MTTAQRSSPGAPARAVIVRNPRARRAVATAELRAAARVIERAGWAVTIVDSERAGHAAELARAAVADGADVVVACGGDVPPEAGEPKPQ
ncbi:MAG: diacylglycerol kinase family protein, partial [Dehalococcoidia bacterium]